VAGVSLVQALLWAFRQNFHADHSNASIHCGTVRYSPLTFRLAEQIAEHTKVDQDHFSDVWMVLVDKGAYVEDAGR
jgi:hypothetical protein